MSAIILYYSKSGTVEKLAQRICKDLGCRKLRIEPEKEYGNYLSAVIRVAKEKRRHSAPAYVTEIPDLTAYDVVLVGYPIWYQDVPSFVADFLEKCDLDGKTVVPFAAFGSTGIKWTMKTLHRVCRGAVIKYPFNYGSLKKDSYEQWLKNVKGLPEEQEN